MRIYVRDSKILSLLFFYGIIRYNRGKGFMNRVAYFDMATILILIPIFVAIVTKKLYKSTSSKLFIATLICTFFAAIFDILCCYPKVISYETLWVATTFYFVFRTAMPLLYLIYIIVLTDSYGKIKKSIIKTTSLYLPYLVGFILISLAYPTGFVFTINSSDTEYLYARGPGMAVLYVTSIVYLIIGIIYILRHRSFFNPHQFISILAIFPISVATVLVQYFVPWLMVELFGTALALVLVSLSIEAPDELIDSKTGLNASKQFFDTINKAMAVNKELYVLVIKIENYSELFNLMDFQESSKFIKIMSTRFNNNYRKYSKYYRTFYIEDGLFAATFIKKENLDTVAQIIYNDLSGFNRRSDYIPKFSLLLIDLLDDFKDMSSFVALINNYHSRKMFNVDFVYYHDVKNRRDFIIQNNIENVIEEGFRNNEFEVYYQPIYDTKAKKFRSAEALIRLSSAKYGFVTPNLFISHAEKNGKIIQIDNFVFEEVFKFISSEEFKKLGLEYIEVNLSMVDCSDKHLFDRIKNLMDKYNINPENINLEVTESVDADYEMIDHNIHKLSGLGISFSLDDYGTGYSNIDRFIKLPVEIVKIDKSLADKYKDQNMSIVLKNTFSMVTDLKRKVVIEGVEEEEQAKAFITNGCDFIQGYYYSKPLKKEQFIEFIEEKNN